MVELAVGGDSVWLGQGGERGLNRHDKAVYRFGCEWVSLSCLGSMGE